LVAGFLRFGLGEQDGDILSVRTRGKLSSHSPAVEKHATAIVTHAIALGLIESALYDSPERRDEIASNYVARLQTAFESFPTPEGAVVDFLAKSFESLDGRIKSHARVWSPPPTFTESIERHPSLVATLVAVSVVTILVIVAAAYHLPVSLSP
jgi:hypothetical protein